MQNNYRSLIASLLGTILEYYDFALYAAFAPIIANYFFSPDYQATLTLLTYTLSFLMRPIGALIFGYIGDKYGRKKAFGLPLIFMALFTLAIVLIPPYITIGLLSSVLLIVCRLGQGLCLGAEFGGALVVSLEYNKQNKGVIAGLLGSAVLLGSLSANILSFLLTLSIFPNYFWRIPFIIGAFVGIIGLWVRYTLDESPEFIKLIASKEIYKKKLRNYTMPLIKAASLSGLNGMLGSFIFVYINFYLVHNLK